MGKKNKKVPRIRAVVQNKVNIGDHRLFHYTVSWEKISSILATQAIMLETRVYPGQKLAVWFSTAPDWDNSVKKGPYSGLEKHAEAYGAFRIEMKPEALKLHDWQGFVKTSGESPVILRGMESAGRKFGADPNDWFCCYKDVPVTEETVVGVGYFHDGKWEDLPIDEFKAKYKTKLDNLKIEPLPTIEMVNAKLKEGCYGTPAFTSILGQIAKNNKPEDVSFFAIGNLIHCVAGDDPVMSNAAACSQ